MIIGLPKCEPMGGVYENENVLCLEFNEMGPKFA